MAQVYSARLALFGGGTAGPFSVVVPPGSIWIVRSIDVTATTTGDSAAGSTNGIPWWASGSISVDSGADGHATWQGRQVLNAGDQLTFDYSTGIGGSCSGYVLSTP